MPAGTSTFPCLAAMQMVAAFVQVPSTLVYALVGLGAAAILHSELDYRCRERQKLYDSLNLPPSHRHAQTQEGGEDGEKAVVRRRSNSWCCTLRRPDAAAVLRRGEFCAARFTGRMRLPPSVEEGASAEVDAASSAPLSEEDEQAMALISAEVRTVSSAMDRLRFKVESFAVWKRSTPCPPRPTAAQLTAAGPSVGSSPSQQ